MGPAVNRPARGAVVRRTAGRVVALALVGVAALSACSNGEASDVDTVAATSSAEPSASPSVPVAVTGTVEQIAARLGCTPTIRTDADELRQGDCDTDVGEFSVVTFPAEKYKYTWLDAAAGWGGWYVVGPKWAVQASTKAVATAFQQRIGGTLRDGSVIPQSEGPVAR